MRAGTPPPAPRWTAPSRCGSSGAAQQEQHGNSCSIAVLARGWQGAGRCSTGGSRGKAPLPCPALPPCPCLLSGRPLGRPWAVCTRCGAENSRGLKELSSPAPAATHTRALLQRPRPPPHAPDRAPLQGHAVRLYAHGQRHLRRVVDRKEGLRRGWGLFLPLISGVLHHAWGRQVPQRGRQHPLA